MKITNEFWYYLIVIVNMTITSFVTAVYLHRQDFLNDILWYLPIITILGIASIFALGEIELILYERKEKITASFRKSS